MYQTSRAILRETFFRKDKQVEAILSGMNRNNIDFFCQHLFSWKKFKQVKQPREEKKVVFFAAWIVKVFVARASRLTGRKISRKTSGTRIHNAEVVYVNATYARFIILNALVQKEARYVCKW